MSFPARSFVASIYSGSDSSTTSSRLSSPYSRKARSEQHGAKTHRHCQPRPTNSRYFMASPLGLKDLALMRGTPTRLGSRAFRYFRAPMDAPVTKFLKRGGLRRGGQDSDVRVRRTPGNRTGKSTKRRATPGTLSTPRAGPAAALEQPSQRSSFPWLTAPMVAGPYAFPRLSVIYTASNRR